jgi:hypothetical protein
VENNITAFITHMINKKKAHYLIPKKDIMFLKELGANANVFQEYGWKNSGTIFKSNLLSYGIEYTKEIIDSEVASDGKIIKDVYGIQRIPDLMIIREMKAYYHGLNVDRLVAFCALAALLKVQLANRGYVKRVEQGKDSKPNANLYAVPKSFFSHLGKPSTVDPLYSVKKTGFKNLK